MPRTRRIARVKKKSVETEVHYGSTENGNEYITQIIKEYDEKCKEYLHSLRMCATTMKQQFALIIMETRLSIPFEWGNKTVEEAQKSKVPTFVHTLLNTLDNIFKVKNITQRRQPKKRSLSVANCDDEGYLTVTSKEDPVGGQRSSRIRLKQLKTSRISRSVSRSKKAQLSVLCGFNTPAITDPVNTFGTVTLKVKPNSPQVILRRPMEGEMAISMQGSPLMAHTIVTKHANVNIPLNDGRTISIQPQLGLRVSELPPMEPTLLQQIEVLRDNLIKLCQTKYLQFTNS